MPDPDPRLEPERRRVVIIVTLAALVATAAVSLHLGLGYLTLLPTTPLLVLLVLAPQITGPPRVLALRREDGAILGTAGGPLPAGEGRVVVARCTRRQLGEAEPIYTVDLVASESTRHLVRWGSPATRVRAFAEGLCRLGGWPLVWRDLAGDDVRSPGELDAPLTARPMTGNLRTTVSHPLAEPVPIRWLPDGGVEIREARLGPRLYLQVAGVVLGILAAMVASGMALGAWAGLPSSAVDSELGPQLLRLLAGLALGLLLIRLGVGLTEARIIVTGDAVRLRFAWAGRLARERVLPLAGVNGLYVEAGPGPHHLVFAGDGFYEPAGRFWSLGQALAARKAVLDALRGRPVAGRVTRAPVATAGRSSQDRPHR